jgi:7-carboxy-7-deazaguanine synthase
MQRSSSSLLISEIFCSFQGESTLVGLPTLFIRLAECNLKCSICDTKYAFKATKKMTVKEVLKVIHPFKLQYVCITGGEPVVQKEALSQLVTGLLARNKKISIETNGSLAVGFLPKKVKKVIDVKTPSTGESKSFLVNNLKCISKNDELKFVISNKKDFDFSVRFIKSHKLQELEIPILFSPNLSVKGLASSLLGWILKSGMPITFQPQLHKLIKEKPAYIISRRA